MIRSCDVGSLPYPPEFEKLQKEADILTISSNIESTSARVFLKRAIVNAFIDKLSAGISIPSFPQFRDMNEMFLLAIEGLEKIGGGYVETKRLRLKPELSKILEVAVLEENAKAIHVQSSNPFKLRICITGPYTLSSFFPHRSGEIFRQLGTSLSEIVENSIFHTKHGEVALVSIDEPLFGLIDDPLIDHGSKYRDDLLQTWELIAGKAKAKDVESCIHLHNTSNDLFWEIESLKFIESHVDDPIYEMKATKQLLEEQDKFLKASIAITDFDQLIRAKLGLHISEEVVADIWTSISKKKMKPEKFLEEVALISKRLTEIVKRFGNERVILAGTECGLKGFPTYTSAIECLRRVSKAIESHGDG